MTTLIFDCDGVLADTERDGHRPAFNQTFREFGLPVEWSEEEYGQKLQIAGGKERMASELTPGVRRGQRPARTTPKGRRRSSPSGTSARRRSTPRWSPRAGCRPGRGSAGSSPTAQDAGWTLAVASTSAEPSVRAILEQAVGRERAARFDLVLAGDVVAEEEAGPGHLPARARTPRRPGRRRRSSSRTRATGCSPLAAPACAAS